MASRQLATGSGELATPVGGSSSSDVLAARQRAELVTAVADFLDGSGYAVAGAALRYEVAARGVVLDGGVGLLERRWAAVAQLQAPVRPIELGTAASGDTAGWPADDIATAAGALAAGLPSVVQLLAGNPATGAAILACLNTADTRALRELHPAVAGVVAGVPWADMDTAVVDVVRWRGALPAAVGTRVGRLPGRLGNVAIAVLALAGVTHLDLRGCGSGVTDAVLALLPPTLRVLTVQTLLDSVTFEHLPELMSLTCVDLGMRVENLPPSLRELRLGRCRTLSTANFRHLAALRLFSCNLGESRLDGILPVATLPPSLEDLDLRSTQLPASVSLAHLPRLRVLRCGYTTVSVASLPPCLLELEFPGCRAAPTFEHLHVLQTLNIRDSDCGNASLASLPPSLVTLRASYCKGVTPAAVLPHLPALTTMYVSGTSVGDALVASLPAGLTTLIMLDSPRVTRSATLDHLPALRELDCSGTDLSPSVLAACRARGCVAPSEGVLRGHESSVNCLAVLLDGQLAGGDTGGVVRVHGFGWQGGMVLKGEWYGPVVALAMLPDGRRLAVSSSWSRWTTSSPHSTVLHTVSSHGGSTSITPVDALRGVEVCALAVLAGGLLAAGCGNGNVRFVDVDAAAEVAVLAGHTNRVTALAALSGGRLASGSHDTTVRLWDVSAAAFVATLPGHTSEVWSLAALPDGRLASGEANGSVRLWNVDAATCLDVLTGHTDGVNALTALPDGRLASGSSDGTIRLWTLRGDAVSRLPASFVQNKVLGRLGNKVTAVVTLLDGRLASSDENCVRLWQPPPPPPDL